MSPKSNIIAQYRQETEDNEPKYLHPKAALSRDHSRRQGADRDWRLPYKRDVDRIIHSKAYARYVDKTQVAYLVMNDHIAHRGLHVQLVSNLAKGIAEVLRLNVDLVEAISLGHDVGHPPFGHEGEQYLSELSQEYLCGPFTHSLQSCRLLRDIEPLNLGLAVYDGFLCHDGGLTTPRYEPLFGKTWESHAHDIEMKRQDPDCNLWPTTLEGCLVKLCDTASYIGRDIEDAIRLGLISRDIVPMTPLGINNKDILHTIAGDIVETSYGKDYIAVSDEVFDALCVLRKFNFENIYFHPKLKVESSKVRRSYRALFELLLDDVRDKEESSFLWTHFVAGRDDIYLATTSPAQMVVDYLAGMTDSYFVHTLEKLLIPSQIKLHDEDISY